MIAQSESPGDRIERTIKRVAAQSGALVLRDVTIELSAITEHYSYLLVDRYGLLVIHVELWPDGKIQGASRSGEWTVRAKRTLRHKIKNPLAENARRVDALTSALQARGKRLRPDYFADIVVIEAADVSEVSLRDAQKLRFVEACDLERALRDRYDFAVNSGTLQPQEVEELASLVGTLDRAPVRMRAPVPVRQPAAPAAALAAAPEEQLAAPLTQPPAAPAAPAGFVPTAPVYAASRYPDLSRQRTVSPVKLFLLIGLSAITVWLALYDGYAIASREIAERLGGLSPQMRPTLNTRVAGTDLERAKELFRKSEPEIYAAADDLNFPEVTPVDDCVTYTWHYKDVEGARRSISFTLGTSGELRGVASQ